ncbi:hypothetical protein KQ247_15055 [Ruegeria pomeroyi]|uniref:Uncharacterized protein n=1 Tax=Ruegeria pomeroyi TaxID=89184 RepID=A0A850LNP9_9RHOB|nr:hypothetical protein [Ruegeria pomeroyi]NVK99222.1 hypothetical protein [Ruegeria pomeroyi]NVL01481.1 hypothetical protein [Ruegeria pomeroyi]QWV11100.1 hypothetical protein KQ247_15055 [Ruegeria pomeroyi]
MQVKKRPPRPKRWTMVVVGSCKFLHDDREEILLNFRREYREKLGSSGRRYADNFARAEAFRMLLAVAQEIVVRLGIIGKKILLE